LWLAQSRLNVTKTAAIEASFLSAAASLFIVVVDAVSMVLEGESAGSTVKFFLVAAAECRTG
jgi:hypothetical protein